MQGYVGVACVHQRAGFGAIVSMIDQHAADGVEFGEERVELVFRQIVQMWFAAREIEVV